MVPVVLGCKSSGVYTSESMLLLLLGYFVTIEGLRGVCVGGVIGPDPDESDSIGELGVKSSWSTPWQLVPHVAATDAVDADIALFFSSSETVLPLRIKDRGCGCGKL